MIIASPPPVFPFRYHKVTNRLNQRILSGYLESEVTKLGFRDPLVITFQADSALLVRHIRGCAKVYFCTDDWSAFGRWWQPAARVREMEMELVKVCDLVIATSRRLAARLESLCTPTYFIPNAADYGLFSRAQDLEPPRHLRELRKPVIGFAGMITRHTFDADLINWLARRHPEWSFVIVGKKEAREPDLSCLERLSNVHFEGFQPLDLLPQYMAAMDVCLIPPEQTECVKSVFCLKLFEYLAAGKPVVATWTEEYLPYADVVYLARTPEEFDQAITRALNENSQEFVSRRMLLARENDWDKRVSRFSEVVRDFLAHPESRGVDSAARRQDD